MATNSRFAIAVHTAAMLAFHEGEPVTSEQVACSVRTNPVVIRRILQLLTKAGIVRSQLGKGGGSKLVRSPAKSTLWDLYRAVERDVRGAEHVEQGRVQVGPVQQQGHSTHLPRDLADRKALKRLWMLAPRRRSRSRQTRPLPPPPAVGLTGSESPQ